MQNFIWPCFRPRLALILLCVLIAPGALLAQSEGGAGSLTSSHVGAPVARTIRTSQAITIDGRLDEAIWAEAPVITEFTQIDPFEGQPVSERTEVRIAYDDNAIYVAGMMYDSAPISTRLARRDANVSDSDGFDLYLDSYHDHQTAYRFSTNPSGMKGDAIISGGTGNGDSSWDPIWEVVATTVPGGWAFEMRIPFSQLRFSRDPVQVWGIQLRRTIHRTQEEAVFSFTPKLERGGVPRYGHLEGIASIRPAQRLELLPYVGGRAEYREIGAVSGIDFNNPFRSGSDYFTNAGLDLKYRITSNITLDATVNPDFGQVEVDPAVINLTAFETQFSERRPFFVEGAEIFNFGEGGPAGSTGRGPQLLYSRRIGRAPQGQLPSDAVFADVPSWSTILGAAKVTGKTAGGWSLGMLEAVTGEQRAPYMDRHGERHEAIMEPLTNYFVGRARREFNGNTTRFGIIGTAVHRQLDDPGLTARLRSSAYSGGIDVAHEWSDRTWRIAGVFTPSYITGSPEAIMLAQRSSARYFQRPDATYLSIDSLATSMAGYYAMVDLDKRAGAYQAKIALAGASPSYEANDLGYQTAADRIMLDTNFMYQQTRPGTRIRRWEIRGGPDAVWNYGGQNIFAEVNAFGNITFMNYWGFGWRVAFNPETYNDRLTRGGPVSRDPQGYSGNFSLSSDSRRAHVGRGTFQWATDTGGSWRHSTDLTLTYRPATNWEVRFGPTLTRSYTTAQYVGTYTDPFATETFGRRYLFAGLDQTTLGLETRVNVTFSPRLSFELYAQPLLSSGDYQELKELRAPSVFAFNQFGHDVGTIDPVEGGFMIDPDGTGPAASFVVPDRSFNHRSLLGNAVLRWEWRPGSTLFLVWQQSRNDRLLRNGLDPLADRVGRFDLEHDMRELFGIKPDNIFQIKVNYWLNP